MLVRAIRNKIYIVCQILITIMKKKKTEVPSRVMESLRFTRLPAHANVKVQEEEGSYFFIPGRQKDLGFSSDPVPPVLFFFF